MWISGEDMLVNSAFTVALYVDGNDPTILLAKQVDIAKPLRVGKYELPEYAKIAMETLEQLINEELAAKQPEQKDKTQKLVCPNCGQEYKPVKRKSKFFKSWWPHNFSERLGGTL